MCAAGKATYSSLSAVIRRVVDRERRLTLYSRAYCHLCEDMLAALQALRDELAFEVDVFDVDADPLLQARYGEWVPVLAHGDVELARVRLDPAAIRAYLAEIR